MRLRILSVFCIFVSLSLNCFIGSHRDACKYNLKQRDVFEASSDSCDFLAYTALFTQKNNETLEEYEARKGSAFNFSLIKCIEYYEKLKECNKEEYKYMPAIYGMNVNPNPISTSALERIASGK
nr:hypothetical protein [Leptospira santarosai]